MSTLDQFKNSWEPSSEALSNAASLLDEASFRKIITAKVRTHTKDSFNYFWASFALQLLVYALLCHVMVKYWPQTQILLPSLLGVLLYIPFTVVLMSKFKRVARSQLNGKDPSSIHDYLKEQHQLLSGFLRFKKWYELLLIPISGAIGVILVFTLYVPGGVQAYPTGALITYFITLLSCYYAIVNENKKSFLQPLRQLENLLQEYQQ